LTSLFLDLVQATEIMESSLRTLIVVTNAKSTLGTYSMSPEASKLNVGLGELGVGEEQPEAEDWLGEDIENSICDNFLVDAEETGSVGNCPDDWVRSPDEECVKGDGSEEFSSLASLDSSLWAAIDNEMPDDEDVGNASDGVPAPFLASVLAVCSEQSGQDHDDVCEDEHHDVASIESSQQGEVEEEKWGCQAPVNVTSPVYLAGDVLVGIWDPVLVVLGLAGMTVVDARPIRHAEV